MIKRSARALLIQTSGGECVSFSRQILCEEVAAAFRQVGCREDWMAATIADTVEDYVQLHAESEPKQPLRTGDLTRLVLRILAETGLDDVADCYRRRQEQSEPPEDGCGTDWDPDRVAQVLETVTEPATLDATAATVVTCLRHLGFSRVSDSLILELARHAAPGAAQAGTPPRTAAEPGVLFHTEQQMLRGGADAIRWSKDDIVHFLPVRSLLPTVRASLNMDRLCSASGHPLTELIFLPRLRRLVRDLRSAVCTIRNDVIRAVPHARAYPARVTVVRLDEAVEAGMDGAGAAAVRVAAEARSILERELTGDAEHPLVVKYTHGPPHEPVADGSPHAAAVLPA